MTSSDLTTTERRVLAALAAAWNIYLTLPVEHPNERGEFLRGIHDAQSRILGRPTYRLLRREDELREQQAPEA